MSWNLFWKMRSTAVHKILNLNIFFSIIRLYCRSNSQVWTLLKQVKTLSRSSEVLKKGLKIAHFLNLNWLWFYTFQMICLHIVKCSCCWSGSRSSMGSIPVHSGLEVQSVFCRRVHVNLTVKRLKPPLNIISVGDLKLASVTQVSLINNRNIYNNVAFVVCYST